MKLKNLIAPFMLMTAGTSFGAAGIYDGFLFTTTTGAAPLTFYDIGAASLNVDFDGANLGSFVLGSSLQIGGQQRSFENNSTVVTTNTIFWKVVGAFVGVNLPLQWTQGDVGAPGGLNNPGDKQWGGDVQGANGALVLSGNVLSGLAEGTYTLEVYSEISTNAVNADPTIFNSNGGNNFKASFTVVPEPATAVLGMFGLGLLLRRRRG